MRNTVGKSHNIAAELNLKPDPNLVLHLAAALAVREIWGIRDAQESRGLGDVYKRQVLRNL